MREDLKIIYGATAAITLCAASARYDFIGEYLSPAIVEQNTAELNKAVDICRNTIQENLGLLYFTECVERQFEEQTGDFRAIDCTINEKGMGECGLANPFDFK